jgi:hypothetical protein
MRHAALAFLLLAFCAVSAEAGDAVPAKAATAFYDLVLREKPRGVPDADMRAKLEPLVSSDLNALLAEAAAAEEAHTRKTNNEEPPFVEGDLFSSLFEGATSYTLGVCVTESDKAYCDVNLAYAEPGEAKPTTWTDKVALARTVRGWLVDDIAFGGTWDFGQHGMLRGTLRQVIEDAKSYR